MDTSGHELSKPSLVPSPAGVGLVPPGVGLILAGVGLVFKGVGLLSKGVGLIPCGVDVSTEKCQPYIIVMLCNGQVLHAQSTYCKH